MFDEQNGLSCLECTSIFGLENLLGLLVKAQGQVEFKWDVLGEPCDQSEQEGLAVVELLLSEVSFSQVHSCCQVSYFVLLQNDFIKVDGDFKFVLTDVQVSLIHQWDVITCTDLGQKLEDLNCILSLVKNGQDVG